MDLPVREGLNMPEKDDWKEKLIKIREEQTKAGVTEAENKQLAREWAREHLHPALHTLAAELMEREGIDDAIDVSKDFGGTLEFRAVNSLSIAVTLRYSVNLKYSSDGVTGETRLRLPKPQEPISTTHPDILEWRTSRIIDDFLTKFNSWEF